MSVKIAFDSIVKLDEIFDVSTIQTYSGGGGDNTSIFCPFSESDYAEDTPWPFETIVFRRPSSTGLYHAPYAAKKEALAGHADVVRRLAAGEEVVGGVKGPFGIPSITPEEWEQRQSAKRTEIT
jgi:hypothetical protein